MDKSCGRFKFFLFDFISLNVICWLSLQLAGQHILNWGNKTWASRDDKHFNAKLIFWRRRKILQVSFVLTWKNNKDFNSLLSSFYLFYKKVSEQMITREDWFLNIVIDYFPILSHCIFSEYQIFIINIVSESIILTLPNDIV